MEMSFNVPNGIVSDEPNETDEKEMDYGDHVSLTKSNITIEDSREVNENGQHIRFEPAGSDTTVEGYQTWSSHVSSKDESQVDLDIQKLIVALKLFSPCSKVPLILLCPFGRNADQLNHLLRILEYKNIIQLDLGAGSLEINAKLLQEVQVSLSKMVQLQASRDALNILKKVVSIGGMERSAVETALPHVLYAWQKVLDEHYFVNEFIQIPFNIINTYQRLGYHQKCFEFAKKTLNYFKGNERVLSTFQLLRLESHVASAATNVGDKSTSYRILKHLVQRAKNWNTDHWLTNEIFQDFAQVLFDRKMYEDAYKYQLVACAYYSRKQGDTLQTALVFFRKGQILYRLEKIEKARNVFETVLKFASFNKIQNLAKEARRWLKNCRLFTQAKDMIRIAEAHLDDHPNLAYAKRMLNLSKKLVNLFKHYPTDLS